MFLFIGGVTSSCHVSDKRNINIKIRCQFNYCSVKPSWCQFHLFSSCNFILYRIRSLDLCIQFFGSHCFPESSTIKTNFFPIVDPFFLSVQIFVSFRHMRTQFRRFQINSAYVLVVECFYKISVLFTGWHERRTCVLSNYQG